MLSLAGGLAAFRQNAVSSEITQALNDLFWLLWTVPGTSFEVWTLAAGVAILLDHRARPVFPRWSGYFSVLVAMSFLPGVMALFFKSGPFAYNGVFPWWIPTVMFFLWALVMTPLTFTAIKNEPDISENSAGQIADPAVVAEFARLRAELGAPGSSDTVGVRA
jgi:hypothetical protein